MGERDGAAELAFVGGAVATMDADGSVADAVAVRDGRIQAVGAAAVHDRIGPATDVAELRGRLLLPGFQDAHAHPVYGGLQRLRCDLSGSADAGECLRRVGEYARAARSEWILGGGWETSLFPDGTPSCAELDAVTGARPAYLVNQDHHDAWVNTAALREAGIDRATPDPPDGRIARDSTGQPSGTLHEGATALVTRVLPATGPDEYQRGLLEGQRYLQARGVTAWQDAIIGSYLGYADTLPVYQELDRLGLLTGRVRGALWWDRDRDEAQIEELVGRRDAAAGHRFRADTVKIMQDGVCENQTAALLLPYLGGSGIGTSYVERGVLSRAVPLLEKAGFALHFHAVGDRAVRDALDAIATARRVNGPAGPRHQIAHVQIVRPGDIPRFAALGVTANIQAGWAVNDRQMRELTTPYLGPERAAWQYPFRALRDAGAVLAAGSDWPVSDAAPMRAVHVAVNRRDSDADEPFLPTQALEIGEALAAYTTGSAWVNHLDQRTGSVEPGKLADLVVLDRNPLLLPAGEIGATQVDLTLIDGRVVYERPP